MDRRRAGMAMVACSMVLAIAHPPRLRADLNVHPANPAGAPVQRLELGIAGLTAMVTADAVRR